jgi:cardiolipin synthase
MAKERAHSRKKRVVAGIVILAIAGGVFLWRRSRERHQFHLHAQVADSGEGFSRALEQTVGSPLRPGHKVQVLENGSAFDSLIEEIGKARETVHIEMYIWSKGEANDRVTEALRKRNPSVKCRILLDWLGSISRGDEVNDKIRGAGCELSIFRPWEALTDRNHRKIAVVDGKVGFTGGFGVDDRWLGKTPGEDHWRDTNVRVEGPAVADMQEAFTEDWQEATDVVIPGDIFPKPEATAGAPGAFVRSTAQPVVTRADRLTQLMIVAAHKRLWISNAYFVPGTPVLDLLQDAAKRGVDVRLLVPGHKSDSKISFLMQQHEYPRLLERGVHIWEYQRSMMHAKTMVIDSTLAVIGSVNLDPLSLGKLEEGALVVQDPEAVERLAKDFEADCADGVEQK